MGKDDDQAFIFTLKNPHRVEPTRYMKKEDSTEAIRCNPDYGPLFGNNTSYICIADNCSKENSCWITKLSNMQYECHPKYKSSLYVKSNGSDKVNSFSVSDYEVYTHQYFCCLFLQQNNLPIQVNTLQVSCLLLKIIY